MTLNKTNVTHHSSGTVRSDARCVFLFADAIFPDLAATTLRGFMRAHVHAYLRNEMERAPFGRKKKRCWAISPAKTQDKTPQEARFGPESGPAALFAGKKCPQLPVLKP